MPRVLVVGPSWVGDMVMAQSLFKQLRAQGANPVDVLAPAWSLPILARMPQVDKAVILPTGHGQLGLGVRWQVAQTLRDAQYDQAIVLPGSWKSALVPALARIPKRTGFRGEMRYGLLNDLRRLDPKTYPLTVQRFVALAKAEGAPLPEPFPFPMLEPASVEERHALLLRLGLNPDQPAIALMPGAEYGPAKQWPLPHFQALGAELLKNGFQVWILGSAKDAPAGQAIAASLKGPAFDLCGKTDLVQALDLLASCAGAVTHDSGLMHVASALDCPLVALYGSSSPEHTPPLSSRAAILFQGLDCAPCFKRRCPHGHTRCLADIRPPDVFETLMRQIRRGLPPPIE
jgi:heptosyltransferase II